MKERVRKNLLSVFGVMFLIFGGLFTINFYLNSNYIGLFGSAMSVIIGIVLLAIVFGE